MNKPLIAAAVTGAVGVATVAGLGVASAATTNSSTTTTNSATTAKTDPMSSLVDAIVSKFNLKKADVQAVFDAQRTKMEANREAEVKAKVSQLVTDGKLTQAQADAINTKRAELEKQRDADRATMDSKTDAERRSTMDAKRTELDSWLKDQGIDTQYSYLLMGGGRGHGGPGGMHGMRRGQDNQASSNTTTSTTSTTDSTTN